MNRNTKPNIKIVTSTEIQRNFGDTIRRVVNTRDHLIIESGGFHTVAIIPVVDYKTLTKALEKQP